MFIFVGRGPPYRPPELERGGQQDAECWRAKAEKDGNLAPQRKLAGEKPKGETVDYDTLVKTWTQTANPPQKKG